MKSFPLLSPITMAQQSMKLHNEAHKPFIALFYFYSKVMTI